MSLLSRLRGDRGQRGTRRTLRTYFVAQDIRERASSSHIQYQTRLARRQATSCSLRVDDVIRRRRPVRSLALQQYLLRTPYQRQSAFERVFTHIDAALGFDPAARQRFRAVKRRVSRDDYALLMRNWRQSSRAGPGNAAQ